MMKKIGYFFIFVYCAFGVGKATEWRNCNEEKFTNLQAAIKDQYWWPDLKRKEILTELEDFGTECLRKKNELVKAKEELVKAIHISSIGTEEKEQVKETLDRSKICILERRGIWGGTISLEDLNYCTSFLPEEVPIGKTAEWRNYDKEFKNLQAKVESQPFTRNSKDEDDKSELLTKLLAFGNECLRVKYELSKTNKELTEIKDSLDGVKKKQIEKILDCSRTCILERRGIWGGAISSEDLNYCYISSIWKKSHWTQD